MNIKHLVISGGGPSMLQSLGALHYLSTNSFLHLNNIKTIYGTSAGALVGTLICLKYDWETVNDYIIKRPWKDVFKINIDTIFESYKKKGLFDTKTVEKCLKPLFDAKDLSLDITFEEFYKYSNIELHMFAFDINEFKLQDISYLTYPKLPLIKGIQMTCGLPILVTPVCVEDKCFIDGGLISNYPLKYCIDAGNNPDEILGLKNQYDTNTKFSNHIDQKSTMLDYLITLFFKIIHSLSTKLEIPYIKNEVICNSSLLTVNYLKESLNSVDIRKNLFDNGSESAKLFISKLENGV
jgi:predicted acylesterase/phospholipase RssA